MTPGGPPRSRLVRWWWWFRLEKGSDVTPREGAGLGGVCRLRVEMGATEWGPTAINPCRRGTGGKDPDGGGGAA